jgi:hypothetical protein
MILLMLLLISRLLGVRSKNRVKIVLCRNCLGSRQAVSKREKISTETRYWIAELLAYHTERKVLIYSIKDDCFAE